MAKKAERNLVKIGSTWYFRKRINNEMVKRSLQTSNKSMAKTLRDEYLSNLVKYGQIDPPSISGEENQDITFGEFAEKWAEIHKVNVRHSTWRDYKSAMNLHILPVFGNRPIKDISYTEVLSFRNSLEVGPKRKNNIIVPMKSVFDMAFQENIISDNVLKKIKAVPEEKPDIHPFTYPETKAISAAVDPWYQNYVEVAFFTGMRASELSGLKWTDYRSMANGPEIHIRRAYVYGVEGSLKTKGSLRNIMCLSEVVNALERQKKMTGGSEYIFLTKDGNRIEPDHFRDVVWKPALKRAGLEYRPPIQTRHTFATMMLSSGEEVGWVQKMLGHTSPQMIYQRYFSWIPNHTRLNGSAFRDSVNEFEQQNENADEHVPVGEKQVIAEQEGKCTKIVPIDDYRKKKKNKQNINACFS